ncbi:MAG: hypothetical protein WCB68_20695 [Pyrinomonadaceae bacterium]
MATERLETILAQARQLSIDELAQLIKQATDLLIQSRKHAAQPASSYASLFGSGKGAFATREEADHFICEERNAWDE